LEKLKKIEKNLFIDISKFNYTQMSLDLHSKIHEVENFLIEFIDLKNKKVSVSTEKEGMEVEPNVRAKSKYAVSSAMEACYLASNLSHMILR
jgi:uncharacterized protein YjaG (DUF416 family)